MGTRQKAHRLDLQCVAVGRALWRLSGATARVYAQLGLAFPKSLFGTEYEWGMGYVGFRVQGCNTRCWRTP